ncbi:MAG: nicotinate (nicotinamide) nucleotide adenylyltransferase [Bryobacterales bacterium]|nr:nicotinate (nicotinamide) nucleotide adenylyltransferase [Bryobacterales bacterium]
MSRLALYGGGFDPVHEGHVRVAREAADAFALSRVLFVPADNPPHKDLRAPYEHRVRMLELALAGDERLEASRLDAGTTHSYSIDTIGRLRRQIDPADQLFFLIGADAFAEIETWVRWRDVLRAVEFIVVSRPGHRYSIPTGARVHRLDTLSLEHSSSGIRGALAATGDAEGLAPAVLAYIRENGLYGVPLKQWQRS